MPSRGGTPTRKPSLFVHPSTYPSQPAAAAPVVSAAVELLFGPDGLASPHAGDREAASQALGSCLAAAPVAAHEAMLPRLEALLDRSDHDALTRRDVEVWGTPEGVLSSEVVPEGVYVGEVVASKNVRKARGRMRVSGAREGAARAAGAAGRGPGRARGVQRGRAAARRDA